MITSVSAQIERQMQSAATSNDFSIAVNSEVNKANMTKAELIKAVFSVSSADQKHGLHLQSFKVKIPGQQSISINGNRFGADAIKALADIKSGDQIVVYDGIADTKNSQGPVSIKGPIIVTITDGVPNNRPSIIRD